MKPISYGGFRTVHVHETAAWSMVTPSSGDTFDEDMLRAASRLVAAPREGVWLIPTDHLGCLRVALAQVGVRMTAAECDPRVEVEL